MIYVYMNVTNRKHPNVYKQIFLDHWEGFKKDNPWYDSDHCNELVLKWHPKYGTFYEGFDNFIAKSPPSPVVNKKEIGYNENYEQLMLLS